MFKMITKEYNQVMKVQPVIMITQVLNLLTAILKPYIELQQQINED